MYGAVVTPSSNADFDVFFLHNEGYSTMCGHAIIALTTLAVEGGLMGYKPTGNGSERRISFNVPAGRIEARATLEQGEARAVSFRNVPSFVFLANKDVKIPEIGHVHLDVAYGGAFYALVDAPSLGLELTPRHVNRLIDYGRRIKCAVASAFRIEHPFEPDLSFLYGTIFTGPAQQAGHHSRNVCIFADGEVDRSATGSGVSARAALHYAKGELELREDITIESIIGSTMSVQAAERTTYGPYDAVIPEVGGTAFITGRSEFCFDPHDPLATGFLVR
jgi:trans-L-3-hydroxyproline dehydratase